MEDTLGGTGTLRQNGPTASLNPCFNGRYFRRGIKRCVQSCANVLILVLMEDTLGGIKEDGYTMPIVCCLNPCFNGRYSRSHRRCSTTQGISWS